MRTVCLRHTVLLEVEGVDDWHQQSWAELIEELDLPEEAVGSYKGYDWLRKATVAEYTWTEYKDTYTKEENNL